MSYLSVDQARERILSHFQPVTTETLPLSECSKRVLGEDIAAANHLPPFDNSSMDGFAVRAEDVENATSESPRSLRVIADIPAGKHPTISIEAGETARIMTGAEVPAGANAVIPVEDTDFNDRDAGTPPPEEVRIFKPAKPGWNIRPRGMDILSGQLVLHKGRLLKPQDLGLLAMLGIANVLVFRRPRYVFNSHYSRVVN